LQEKIKVSIIGSTGYTGAELVRLLLLHPEVEIDRLTSESFAGQRICDVYPSLKCTRVCEPLEVEKISSPFVFVALPHGVSAPVVRKLYDKGLKVVDLSADFRLNDERLYEKWYGITHPEKELLSKAVYGLPELNREKIKKARLVANPGCYPSSVILALAPLLKNDLVEVEGIVVDSKSGVTGAGRSLSLKTHFPEVNENINAYTVTGHRHIPEMEQELTRISGKKMILSFTPHLIPVNRGILSTCYADLKSQLTPRDLVKIYSEFYAGEPFIEILPPGVFPHTREVIWSNRCRIGLDVDVRCGKVKIISVIDNLGKGASGQAVQNMNLMCGFDEKMGLN